MFRSPFLKFTSRFRTLLLPFYFRKTCNASGYTTTYSNTHPLSPPSPRAAFSALTRGPSVHRTCTMIKNHFINGSSNTEEAAGMSDILRSHTPPTWHTRTPLSQPQRHTDICFLQPFILKRSCAQDGKWSSAIRHHAPHCRSASICATFPKIFPLDVTDVKMSVITKNTSDPVQISLI